MIAENRGGHGSQYFTGQFVNPNRIGGNDGVKKVVKAVNLSNQRGCCDRNVVLSHIEEEVMEEVGPILCPVGIPL